MIDRGPVKATGRQKIGRFSHNYTTCPKIMGKPDNEIMLYAQNGHWRIVYVTMEMPFKSNTKTEKDKSVGNKGGKEDRWFERLLAQSEFEKFVNDAKNSLDNAAIKRAYIGDITPDASHRIERVSGKNMRKIMIDNGQIRHAYRKASHNIEPGDIFHIREVINTATDISMSEKEFLHSPALIFKKDLDGEITFLVQVRAEHGGWLAFADCWRQKKVRK
ncbi:hypothetical protein AGMMS49940_23060 [Spirochaetia bacterium]|nr:hypothetical protein AGMMS49940_23060 [Spirochaetia bacterium]